MIDQSKDPVYRIGQHQSYPYWQAVSGYCRWELRSTAVGAPMLLEYLAHRFGQQAIANLPTSFPELHDAVTAKIESGEWEYWDAPELYGDYNKPAYGGMPAIG